MQPPAPIKPPENKQPSKLKNRSRNISWFNTHFSKSMATDVGRKFLNIVKQSFQCDQPLKKIFNKNTLKISYSCMPNLGKKISTHNRSVLQQPQAKPTKTCNCRTPSSCPLSGDCLTQSIIYQLQATVKSKGREETHIGLIGDQSKSRYRNHTAFRNSEKQNATELSKYVWELKDKGAEFTLIGRSLGGPTCIPTQQGSATSV